MLKLRLRYFTSALQKRKHTHYWRAILYDMFYILPYCSSFVRYVVCVGCQVNEGPDLSSIVGSDVKEH